MNLLKTIAAGAVFAVMASSANAAVIYASSVDEVNRGGLQTDPAVDAFRDDPNAALGAPDAVIDGGILKNVYSLGIGGDITLGFGQTFNTSQAQAYEITFGEVSAFPESVDIFAVLNGAVGAFIGSLTNLQAQGGAKIGADVGLFNALKFVDTSSIPAGNTALVFDGFDLDSVGVTPVPLPAAGFLLLGGLAGLGAMRARKKAA